MSKLVIEIEVIDGEERITLTDNIGNVKKLDGVFVVGGSLLYSEHYMLGIGKPSEIALAFGEGLSRAIERELHMGDSYYSTFYKCLLAEMVRRTGGKANMKQGDAEEVLDRWNKEDKDKCKCEPGQCVCKNRKGPLFN